MQKEEEEDGYVSEQTWQNIEKFLKDRDDIQSQLSNMKSMKSSSDEAQLFQQRIMEAMTMTQLQPPHSTGLLKTEK